MSKAQLTLNELKHELAELNKTHLQDIHTIVNDISRKLDIFIQAYESSKVVEEKKVAKPKAAKKGKKAKTETDEPKDTDDTTSVVNDNQSEAPTDVVLEDVEETETKAEPAETTEDPEPEEKKAKKTTKKKAEPKKPKKPTNPKKKEFNRLEYFNHQYDTDPSIFYTYLTESIRKKVDADHKKEWAELDEESLYAARKKALYNYMCKNFAEILQNMKMSYNGQIAQNSVVIANKEDDD